MFQCLMHFKTSELPARGKTQLQQTIILCGGKQTCAAILYDKAFIMHAYGFERGT